jgi:carboxylesterase type B
LNVNVYVPHRGREGTLLPVLLWAYGGAFSEGGISAPCWYSKLPL